MTFEEWYGSGPGVANHDPALAENMRKVARLAWNAAVEVERERCAKVAAEEGEALCHDSDSIQFRVGAHIANAIRSGG